MNILELPQEVRDLILEHFFSIGDLSTPTVLYVKKWNTKTDKDDPTATRVLHSSLPTPPHALCQLSLVNRQLHQESKSLLTLLRRAKPDEPTLKLDLLLDDLTTYYATWLRVLPFPGSVVKTLHITIRPFFALQYGRDVLFPVSNAMNAYIPGQVSIWRLGAVINSILRFGPARMHLPKPSSCKPFTIEKIVVNIQAPKGDENVRDENDVQCIAIARQQALHLGGFARACLEDCLSARTGGVTNVPWGAGTLQHVGRIEFLVDGVAVKEIDLAAHAKRLGVTPWSSEAPETGTR
jgi:hypothetical protein